jgi:putative flippase GtrA
VATDSQAQRIERVVSDRYGSMTVRLITYDTSAPAPHAGPIGIPADLWQLVRFCCVGGSGYVLNLAVFRLADAWMPYVPAFAAAFVLSALSNFLWNRLWTFPEGTGRRRLQLARFLTVSVAALALDLLLLSTLVELAGLPKLPAAAIAIAAVTPFSFLAQKHWSFASG